MENQRPTFQKRKKIPSAVWIIMAGGVIAVVAYVIDLAKLFNVYGCASQNLNNNCASKLPSTNSTKLVGLFIYIGIGIIVLGIVILILQLIHKKRQPVLPTN